MTRLNVQIPSHPAITLQSWDDFFFPSLRFILNALHRYKTNKKTQKTSRCAFKNDFPSSWFELYMINVH